MEKDALNYSRVSAETQKNGVLGKLVGACADVINETRNGRKYTEELWEKVFDSPLVTEQFEAGGIFGELTHPDYEEVNIEKVAVVMPHKPKLNSDGLYIGEWNILDTPCGRILKTLCDYGYKPGISTRGTGDIIEDADGNQVVDPDTYQLNALDIVLIPAVKAARLQYVAESLEKKRYNKTLKESLLNIVEKANDEDKKAMTETLDELGINLEEEKQLEESMIQDLLADTQFIKQNYGEKVYNLLQEYCSQGIDIANVIYDKAKLEEFINYCKEHGIEVTESVEMQDGVYEVNEECNNESCSDKETVNEGESIKEVDNVEPKLVAELQEQLLKIKQLMQDNRHLREQLSVCNAKESDLSEQLCKYKAATASLSRTSKQTFKLSEALRATEAKLDVRERVVSCKVDEIKNLRESYDSLLAKTEELKANYASINESLTEAKGVIAKKSKLVDDYKASYTALKDKYLEKASECSGLQSEEVRKQLGESYKIKDIDSLCENMAQTKSNLRKLPFAFGPDTTVSIKSINESISGDEYQINDDFVSEDLRNLVGLN